MYRIIGADGREYGPVSAEQIRMWIAEGRVGSQILVSAEGSSRWQPAAVFPEFSDSLKRSAVPDFSKFRSSRQTNTMATMGMILGILSLTFGLCCYGVPFNVIGLVFSIIGLAQIRGRPDLYEGQGVAIAGIVLCALSLLLTVGLGIFAALFAAVGEPHRHPFRN